MKMFLYMVGCYMTTIYASETMADENNQIGFEELFIIIVAILFSWLGYFGLMIVNGINNGDIDIDNYDE